MSETMVERVARAIYDAAAKHEGTGKTWDDLLALIGKNDRRFAKEAYECVLAEARAAIEAMREPTPAMIRARWPTYHPWGQNAPPPEERQGMFDEMAEKTTVIWRTMLDAALAPASPTPLDTPPSQVSDQ